MNDWKAKLEIAYSFMLKYSKITVWIELRVAEEEFWLIYSLGFASLVE